MLSKAWTRKLSIKKGSHVFDKDNSFNENKIAMNMEESLKFTKIEEVINENPEKNNYDEEEKKKKEEDKKLIIKKELKIQKVEKKI